jgi:hypothetical protein
MNRFYCYNHQLPCPRARRPWRPQRRPGEPT